MFLRRQDVIDRFEANFRHGGDGQILFHPPGAKHGAPVSAEEYDAVIAAFERRHRLSMMAMWVIFIAAGVHGGYRMLAFDDYASFFIGFGVAVAMSFALSLQAHTALLSPFMTRREALRAGR